MSLQSSVEHTFFKDLYVLTSAPLLSHWGTASGNQNEYDDRQHTGFGDSKRPSAWSTIPGKISTKSEHEKERSHNSQAEASMYQGALQQREKPKLLGDHAAGMENRNSEEKVAED